MKIAQIINKLFGRLPKPYALPMRGWGSKAGDFTWDDWREQARAKHPFRFWLHETFPHWIRVHITMKIEHWWYWLRTHTYNRYHILDLRSDVGLTYKWGWVEVDQAMMLACFNLLRSFVEKQDGLAYLKWEDPNWYANASQDEKDMHDKQRADLIGIKTLYDWWMTGRQKEHEALDAAYERDSGGMRLAIGNPKLKAYGEALRDLDSRDDEMLAKLMKYRRHLWT
jgi:hypothetical protein